MKENLENPKIKCVIWDLDNTLWEGILLENDIIKLNEEVVEIIKILDQRGIINSIASRNDYESAKQKICALDLWEYFIYPEIGWHNKSQSIKRIAENMNIGIDTCAFVDDQIFEREEVKFTFPNIHTYSPDKIITSIQDHIFIPTFITKESSLRRHYYQAEMKRKKEEEVFEGNNIDFMESLGLKFTIKYVTEEDLQRAEELTIRTHQLNTTGITYSYSELYEFMQSDKHALYVCSLEDKYGSYGTVGLSLVEKVEQVWRIKLLLMSCRVMSRNAGNIFIGALVGLSKKANVKLQTEFVQNDKNRPMYVTYKFNGFNEIFSRDNYSLLELSENSHIQIPAYAKINYLL